MLGDGLPAMYSENDDLGLLVECAANTLSKCFVVFKTLDEHFADTFISAGNALTYRRILWSENGLHLFTAHIAAFPRNTTWRGFDVRFRIDRSKSRLITRTPRNSGLLSTIRTSGTAALVTGIPIIFDLGSFSRLAPTVVVKIRCRSDEPPLSSST